MNPRATTKFAKGQGIAVRHSVRRAGFTLLELMVVIAIIALLVVLGLPAIRGMTKSNAIAAADRQLLDDIAFARQRAIGDHTTVCMVFVPPNICSFAVPVPTADTNYTVIHTTMTNLYTGQFTTYALIALRTVGDQPGFPTPHYLTGWRTLPTGVYIATNKFYNITAPPLAPPFPYTNFPFPMATNTNAVSLPYIAFNYLGQPVRNLSTSVASLQPEFIPLARGSIFYADDGSGTGAVVADISESHPSDAYYQGYNSQQAMANQLLPSPPDASAVYYNEIYIDPLTGRPRVLKLDVQ